MKVWVVGCYKFDEVTLTKKKKKKLNISSLGLSFMSHLKKFPQGNTEISYSEERDRRMDQTVFIWRNDWADKRLKTFASGHGCHCTDIGKEGT